MTAPSHVEVLEEILSEYEGSGFSAEKAAIRAAIAQMRAPVGDGVVVGWMDHRGGLVTNDMKKRWESDGVPTEYKEPVYRYPRYFTVTDAMVEAGAKFAHDNELPAKKFYRGLFEAMVAAMQQTTGGGE